MSERGIGMAISSLTLGLALFSGCAAQKVERHGAVIAIPEENIAE